MLTRTKQLKYIFVAQEIERLIEKSALGDRLPSDREIARTFGCSPLTVRKALDRFALVRVFANKLVVITKAKDLLFKAEMDILECHEEGYVVTVPMDLFKAANVCRQQEWHKRSSFLREFFRLNNAHSTINFFSFNHCFML